MKNKLKLNKSFTCEIFLIKILIKIGIVTNVSTSLVRVGIVSSYVNCKSCTGVKTTVRNTSVLENKEANWHQ